MKNTMVLFSLVIVLAFAGSAFATEQVSLGGAGNHTIGVASGQTAVVPVSKNVYLGYHGTLGSGVDYSAGAVHKAGTREYATSNDQTSIYYKVVDTGTEDPSASEAVGFTVATGWSAQ